MIYALRRILYRRLYQSALSAYWDAENMSECRDAWRRLCWFGVDGGFK